jgi:hypothetical protein
VNLAVEKSHRWGVAQSDRDWLAEIPPADKPVLDRLTGSNHRCCQVTLALQSSLWRYKAVEPSAVERDIGPLIHRKVEDGESRGWKSCLQLRFTAFVAVAE